MISDLKQNVRAILSTPSDREFRLERTFNAPRAKVWRAMTEPDLIKQWWGRGNPLTIERFERMVLTFEWDGMPGYVIINTVTLEQLPDDRTRLVSASLFHTTAERDGVISSGMEGGANQSYEMLDRVLAALS